MTERICLHDWLTGLDGAYDSADYWCVRCGAEHNGPDRPDRGPVPPPKRTLWDKQKEELQALCPPGQELLSRYRELVEAARPILAIADAAANSDARSTAREREALRALLTEET
jgi:hypothetical protein